MDLLAVYLILFSVINFSFAEECFPRSYGKNRIVCVCNSEHCDTFPSITKLENSKYIKITSNEEGHRFVYEEGNITTKSGDDNVITIGKLTYQTVTGFGGAFSDSTGFNILSLNKDLQEKILRSYYSTEGIEYSISRVPIGGTDFSLEGYSYCDTETDDPELTKFNLTQNDYLYKIPFIQKALELRNNELDLFASAWIAPNWMKTIPGFTSRFSFIKDKYYQTWADYALKFLEAYKENNITFWGISTGNEALTAYQFKRIPSVAWTIDGKKKWIRENFGPTLRNSQFSDIKILALDDQRILLPGVVDILLEDEEVDKYIDGIAVHWYLDALVSPKVLTKTKENHPDKFILSTEACAGYIFNNVVLGSWDRAQQYADDIISDLNNWVTGWTDWNMVLDIKGGPTFIKNYVDAPILVNASAQEFYKQPTFYAMGHFSKFVPKGSVRIESESFDNDVLVTAFKRPDDLVAVIVLNKKNKDINTTIRDPAMQDITIKLTAKSINTILFNYA